MYLPPHFAVTDPDVLAALMRAHPLATLVASGDAGFSADHLPLEFDSQADALGFLRGHVARANPLWRAAHGQPVMAVFHGPQAYVSPSWYPSKAVHHKVVPTWNYQVVHAHGVLQAIQDADWLRAFLTRLTASHESPLASPWSIDQAPADFIEQMLGAIVGIEIRLTRIEGKVKWSQNRSADDRAGVEAIIGGLNPN